MKNCKTESTGCVKFWVQRARIQVSHNTRCASVGRTEARIGCPGFGRRGCTRRSKKGSTAEEAERRRRQAKSSEWARCMPTAKACRRITEEAVKCYRLAAGRGVPGRKATWARCMPTAKVCRRRRWSHSPRCAVLRNPPPALAAFLRHQPVGAGSEPVGSSATSVT